jgi:DnaJ like chaperone protein
MIFGKLVAGLIGYLTGGVFGLVFGIFIGHIFDRALQSSLGMASPENIARVQQSFFETTFLLLGYLAKADGRISEDEIAHTEQIVARMGLDAEQRQQAIQLFRDGSRPEFELDVVVTSFKHVCSTQRQLTQTLLLFLISLAQSDQTLHAEEHAALVRISSLLGVGAMQLEMLIKMTKAQSGFHGQSSGSSGMQSTLKDAYTALGIDSSASDKELKHAYRKLMSEHHPDKLIAKGVPEAMVKLATEQSQEIQSAYEMVRKHRGIGK